MKNLRLLLIPVVAMLVAACASIGRPGGGPRDEKPPVFVRSNPAPGDTGVKRRTFTIYFDENVQLEDAFNKVVISPVQIQAPAVSANGHRVTVELRDTLVNDMTYTIDFGDAIKDLNEGNVLDGFAIDFSTGSVIDTMRISGLVLQASNLEPAQGLLVGAYLNTADTAIRTLPPVRIARTNQLGQFTIRNLAPGTYRVYAFNDINRDYHWDRSEDVAFLDSLIVPSVEAIEVTDTLYDSRGNDSVITRPGRRFLPNDILLTWFNEDYKPQYLKDYKRQDRRRATIILGAPTDSFPRVNIVGTEIDGAPASEWAVEQFNTTGDSLTLWLRDSLALDNDSLRLAVSYRIPDSTEQMYWKTDTLRFFYRSPSKPAKAPADTVPPKMDLLNLTFGTSGTQDVHKPFSFTFPQPVESLDTAAMSLEMLVDTVWTPVKNFVMAPDSLEPLLKRNIIMDWTPGNKYRFSVDSAAIVNIYGEHNPPVNREFSVKALEEYSNLTFTITGADSTAVVELLSSSDAPQAMARVVDGKAVFRYLNPGTYYARLYFDDNGDGKWTTGILDSIQPEEVAYYPKKLDLRRNWDVEQSWDIYELPVDQQKPLAILKNKPKLRRGEQQPLEEDEEDEGDFIGGYNGNRTGTGNRQGRSNNSTRGNQNLGGSFQQMNNRLR